MKVVINDCYGGFGLSDEAKEMYAQRKGIELMPVDSRWQGLMGKWYEPEGITRNDACLIAVIEELKEKANDRCASLKIIEIPDDVEYVIEEYDGNEWVAEEHRTWD